MPRSPKRIWIAAAVVVALMAAAWVAGDWYVALPGDALRTAQYVGRATCAECHAAQHGLWLGSHHDRAMELASEESVLGDFNDAVFERVGVTTRFFRRDGKYMVNTEGPDGERRDYEIKYTFGVEPLQQYMVEFPDGRVQVLRVSWNTQDGHWFEVTPPDVPDERIEPGDPVHWTGVGQNWNTTCADCHSTNVRKNYDAVANTYRTSYEEIDVSCEECHGPGSVHVELARSRALFWDRKLGYGLPWLKNPDNNVQLELCAKCHSHRVQVHEAFRPGRPLLDHYIPSLLSSGLYHADGQIRDEVYEYGSFVQSKMYAQNVKCTDCHDPHSLKLKFSGNQLCGQCHIPARYDTPAHHRHPVGTAGAQCVECHMPSRFYMVIDARRDHSFRMPRPDLSVALGTPNACNDCHTRPDETFAWAAETVRQWYGPTRRDDPHWASAFAAARKGEPEGEERLLEVFERKTTPPIVRASAVDLLANYPTSRSIAARRQALDDFDPLVRRAAVDAIAGQLLPTLESDLVSRLTDRLLAVRVAAAIRLAYLPRERLSRDEQTAFLRALDEFRASQALSLDHAGGHLALGALDRHFGERLRRAGSPREAADLDLRAVQHWQSAIRVEPYIAGPRGELASMLEQLGGDPADIRQLRDEEIKLLERDAKLLPEDGDVRYRIGMMRVLVGELEEATAALQEACRQQPSSGVFRLALALVHQRRYEMSGDEAQFQAAARELRALHELQPSDPTAANVLRELLQTRQRKQQPSAERSPP